MPKRENIQSLFDSIAPDYDRLNHILSCNIDRIWRRKAVREMMDGHSPLAVLDVACGTGDFTMAIARHAPCCSRVLGIDLSEEMMEEGRRKMAAANIEATMEYGDCEALAYDDNTFDRVSVGFGIRNFEHQEVGLGEMWRVLKPGGKLVVLELSVPTNALLRWGYKLYFQHVLPLIGGMVSGNRSAYEYLPASVLNFPPPAKFMAMMREAGFSAVRHRALTFGICRMYIGVK